MQIALRSESIELKKRAEPILKEIDEFRNSQAFENKEEVTIRILRLAQAADFKITKEDCAIEDIKKLQLDLLEYSIMILGEIGMDYSKFESQQTKLEKKYGSE